MFKFVIRERYIKFFQIMNEREKPSVKDISKLSGFQYLHTINVLKQFQSEGLIKPIFNQEEANHNSQPGNPYIVELTLKGKANHKLLNMLYRLHLGMDEKNIIQLTEVK